MIDTLVLRKNKVNMTVFFNSQRSVYVDHCGDPPSRRYAIANWEMCYHAETCKWH